MMLLKELQTVKCKAAVSWGPGEPLTVEEIEVEPPQEMEVRLRMLFASVCHTDISVSKGLPPAIYPRVLGHEGVGVVESVGKCVQALKEGDVVIPSFLGECQECKNCKSGKTNLCLNYPLTEDGFMPDKTTRMSVKGQKLYQLFSCSTFSEFTVVNTNYVVKVDPRVPPVHCSLLSCGFTTGFGAVWKEAKIEKGSSIAVFGLGSVGLGAIAGAQLLGASPIIGVDINDCKKERAHIFGMTHFINPKADNRPIAEVIREMTGGLGVDYSIECSGAAPLLNEALEATKAGTGVTIAVGIPVERRVPISPSALISGKTMKGCLFGGIKPQSDLPLIASMCINKEIQLDNILTHEVGLRDINQAFELSKEPDCQKVVIKFDDESEDCSSHLCGSYSNG